MSLSLTRALTRSVALAALLVAGQVSAAAIPQTDLPPPGTRSLFDHLLAQNDGLPYPFEDLVALLQRYDADGRPPVQLLIPEGRSLLKAQADFALPRLLYAADFQAPNTPASLGITPRGQLFLGFVEGADEIEVISYNEFAGRFEFQLVKDYRAGGVPKIVYAQRAVCLTCHQGEAPIFPQRPWNETNGQPEVAEQIAAARPGQSHYLGVPHAQPLAAPERFDELTDVANFIPVSQRAWLDGCGEQGNACRRQMLSVALQFLWNPGDFDAAGASAQALREAQQASWPNAGIAVPESDIANRDPLDEKRGLRAWLRELLHSAPQLPGAKSNDDLEAFDALPKLPARLDPLTPRAARRVLRADDLDGAFGLAQLFSRADQQLLEQAADYDWATLASAIQALPDDHFEVRPFSRVRSLNALLAQLQRNPLGYCCDDTSALSPPIVGGLPPLELAADSPLQPYQDYCFACHRGNPAARLNFMAGEDAEAVLARIKDTDSIRDALDWQRYQGTDKAALLMPPADSLQRRHMQAAIEAGELSLEQMRDVVPSMFDF